MPSRHPPRAESRARSSLALRPSSRVALRLCCLALLAAPAAAQSTARPSASPEEVVLVVTVTDGRGRHVTGLGREFFSVTDGKAEREVTSFRESGGEPVSVALVFDVSGSMSNFLPALKEAAARLVAAGGGANEYLVGEFGGKGGLRVLADWTRDRAKVAAALSRLATAGSKDGKPKPHGLTFWRDACADAAAKLPGASHERRALVLLGDAAPDAGSRTGDDELKRVVRESGALFYALIATDRDIQYGNVDGPSALLELARATGGQAYFTPNLLMLNDAVERIALELSHQYLVGFTPANAAGAGKLNKVRVKVAKPQTFKGSLLVRSRDGYYSRAVT